MTDETFGEVGRISGQIDRNRETIVELRIEVALLVERVSDLDKRRIRTSHLKQLEAEIMKAVDAKIQHICDHVDSSFDARINLMERRNAARVRKNSDRIIRFGISFAILLIALITALTSGGGAELAKALARMAAGGF